MGEDNQNTFNEFRKYYQEAINKSEDDFEKNLIYLSSGALGLTLIFIEKIVPPQNSIYLFLLILGWVLLTVTLGINLVSHLISKKYIQKSQSEFDDCIHQKITWDEHYENSLKRNKNIDIINWVSLGLFILGIISIVIYTSINFNNMAKQKNTTTQNNVVKSEKINLGRTVPVPQKPIVNITNTNSTKKKNNE
jgi:anaerobic C4-dicarboxylate transporter